MKIMIAGAGKVGKALAKDLSYEGHDITIIDSDPAVLEDAISKYDVITYEGNCATMNVLKEAGIAETDVFIAATNADEVNLLSCITAHHLNPSVNTIARIRDPEYVEQALEMSKELGLSLVVNPEQLAAREIRRLLKYPGFLKRDAFAKARIEIVELKVDQNSRLKNVQLTNLQKIVNSRILIVTVLRNGKAIAPDGSLVIKEDDRLFVTGEPSELQNMITHLGMVNYPIRHVMIAGGGKISYYLAQELEKVKMTATIIENNREKCEMLARELPNCTIIHGDATDVSVLESEDIGEYDAFISMTGLDEMNVVMSLYANMKGVRQIVTKIGRSEDNALLDSLNIGSTVSPKELCTMHILRYVRAMENSKGAALTIHRIADGQSEVLEFEVDETTRHIGEKLKDIPTKKNTLVICICHGKDSEISNGNSSFQTGDTVVVVTNSENILHKLNDIFAD